MKNYLFQKRCTLQSIRESQIERKSWRYRMFHALYTWIENLSYKEESLKFGHAPTWNISWKNHLFRKRCSLQGRMFHVGYIWTHHVPYNEKYLKLGHGPTWNFHDKNRLSPKRCTLQSIRESQIAQKIEDTECFMPCTYKQKYTIKKRNLSRWGLDQLNNFMTKIFVFEKNVPYKASGLETALKR